MDDNQTSISKHTNNTPFVVFDTKKKKKKNERNDQRKDKLHTQKAKMKNKDLDPKQSGGVL
jgi:5'-3' exonuclease